MTGRGNGDPAAPNRVHWASLNPFFAHTHLRPSIPPRQGHIVPPSPRTSLQIKFTLGRPQSGARRKNLTPLDGAHGRHPLRSYYTHVCGF